MLKGSTPFSTGVHSYRMLHQMGRGYSLSAKPLLWPAALLYFQTVNRLGPNGWERSISMCPGAEGEEDLAARIFMPATAAAVRLETPSLCSSAVT